MEFDQQILYPSFEDEIMTLPLDSSFTKLSNKLQAKSYSSSMNCYLALCNLALQKTQIRQIFI
jgi:hypothetical protein